MPRGHGDGGTAERQNAAHPQALFALMLAGFFLCAWILRPFVPALTGVGLIALATRSPIAWLRSRVHSPTWVAILGTAFVSLCIVVPACLVTTAVVRMLAAAVGILQSPGVVERLSEQVTSLRNVLESHDVPISNFDPASTVNSGVSVVVSTLVSLLGSSVSTVTEILVILFLLFFWYRDEQTYRRRIRKSTLLLPAEQRFVVRRLRRCVRATVVGRMLVAAAQGLLAWITFLALGIPGATILANVTAVCSLIPALGAFIVWLPVVFYLLLLHAWAKALILVLVGTLVLSTADNVLFPIIVGSHSDLDTPEMFLSVFGGIGLFGISGLVIGPLLWVFTGALAAIWSRRSASV